MKFRTSRFGEIEFNEEVIMNFPEGVLGFPESQRYVLLEHDANGSPFKWLQSLDNADLAFIVIDPYMIVPDYHFDIDMDTERIIGTDDQRGCALMAITNIPHGAPLAMTANLKAPLVINAGARLGRQLVLSSNYYQINTPVFPALNEVRDMEDAEMERAVS